MQIRPRFRFVSHEKPACLAQMVEEAQTEHADTLKLDRRDLHLVLSFLPQHQQVWSPQLTLEIEAGESGSLVRGLFAPNPSIWTFFMFMYGGFATLGLFMAMFGSIQHTLKHTPWALWISPLFLLGLIFTYLANRYGQQKAEPQMAYLRQFLQEAIGEKLQAVEPDA